MRAVPVEKYLIRLDPDATIDDNQACEDWTAFVRAQGWTPVGEPRVVRDPAHGEAGVIGRLVREDLPGVIINTDALAITLP